MSAISGSPRMRGISAVAGGGGLVHGLLKWAAGRLVCAVAAPGESVAGNSSQAGGGTGASWHRLICVLASLGRCQRGGSRAFPGAGGGDWCLGRSGVAGRAVLADRVPLPGGPRARSV